MRPLPDVSSHPSADPTCRPEGEPTLSGLESLADLELLCLLLDRVPGGVPARRLASNFLGRFGGLGDITAADVPELARLPETGSAVNMELKLLRQLSIPLERNTASRRPVLSSS